MTESQDHDYYVFKVIITISMLKHTIIYVGILVLIGGLLEIGYIIGFSSGEKNALNRPDLSSPRGRIDKSLSDIKVIIGNNKTYDWIKKINGLPTTSFLRSDWTTSIKGELVSIDDSSVTLFLNGENHKLIMPIPINEIKKVKFSKYLKINDEYLPESMNLESFAPGDIVSLDTTIETLTGKVKLFELVKIDEK